MIFLIVLLAVAAAALGAWSASTTLATNAGSSSKRGIRAMEDYEVADVREQEMLAPWSAIDTEQSQEKALALEGEALSAWLLAPESR